MTDLTKLLLSILTISIAACGGGGGGDSATKEESISPEIKLVVEEQFGSEGNLWKPASDDHASGAGNLVVLFTSRYKTQFDGCKIPLRDGTFASLVCINNQPWSHVPFSCFSNGGRQTWRANFKCSAAARVEVICQQGDEEIVFTVPSGSTSQVCSRFG